MLSQHPQILIQYEDDTNLETVVNEISTIIQFFCVMIGNIFKCCWVLICWCTILGVVRKIFIKIDFIRLFLVTIKKIDIINSCDVYIA